MLNLPKLTWVMTVKCVSCLVIVGGDCVKYWPGSLLHTLHTLDVSGPWYHVQIQFYDGSLSFLCLSHVAFSKRPNLFSILLLWLTVKIFYHIKQFFIFHTWHCYVCSLWLKVKFFCSKYICQWDCRSILWLVRETESKDVVQHFVGMFAQSLEMTSVDARHKLTILYLW